MEKNQIEHLIFGDLLPATISKFQVSDKLVLRARDSTDINVTELSEPNTTRDSLDDLADLIIKLEQQLKDN